MTAAAERERLATLCEDVARNFLSVAVERDFLAIAAFLRAPAIPDGWRLVPVEQTDDMIFAAAEEWARAKDEGCVPLVCLARHWHASLAAAPQPKDPRS